MAAKASTLKLNSLSEWQIELKQFQKNKLKLPVFINTFLTPEDADVLLEENEHNRTLLMRYVDRYQRFMDEGKWVVNADCIKVGSDGSLIDGQHRLVALKEHGKPVMFSVAIGVDPKNFVVTDTGKSRNASDILSMAGYINCTSICASLRYLMWFNESESFSGYTSISPSDVLTAVKRWPHIQDFIYPAARVGRFAPQSIICFFMYTTMTINEGKSLDFFAKLTTGERLGKTSSIRMLREMLIKLHMQKMRLDKRHMVACFIIAWNAFIENQRIKSVRWDGIKFPMITGLDRKKLFKPMSGFKENQFKE